MKSAAQLKSEIRAAKQAQMPLDAAAIAAWAAHRVESDKFYAANSEPPFPRTSAVGQAWRDHCQAHRENPAVIAWEAAKVAALSAGERAAHDASNKVAVAKQARFALEDELRIVNGLAARALNRPLGSKVLAVVEIAPGMFRVVRDAIASGRYVAAEVSAEGYVIRAIGPTGSRTPSYYKGGSRVLPVIELPR